MNKISFTGVILCFLTIYKKYNFPKILKKKDLKLYTNDAFQQSLLIT